MKLLDHPNDAAHREWLRTALITARQRRGWGQPTLADRLDRATNAVVQLETATGWRVPVLQHWARGLGLTCTWHLLGLPNVDPYPLPVPSTSTQDADAWSLAVLAHALTEARKALEVSQAELARRLGNSRSVVAMWELRCGQGTYLWAVQARARALGGELRVGLTPASQPVGVVSA